MGITEKLAREIAVRAPGWRDCRILYTGGGCFVAVAKMNLPGIGPALVSVNDECAVIPMNGGKPISSLDEYMHGEVEDEAVLACPGPDGELVVFTDLGEKMLSPVQKREIAAVVEAMADVLLPN